MTASAVTISTQNLNGFARNKAYLNGLCDRAPNAIRAFQEHWLAPPLKRHLGVNQLKCLHKEFDGWGTSAMRQKMESQIRIGRPFGGTGFIWNKKYSLAIKTRLEYKHDRVSVIELNDKDGKILLFSAYMPFYDVNNLEEQRALYLDTISFIDSIMQMNPHHSYIILTDLNCNIYDTSHPFSTLVLDLMQRHRLISTFDLIDNFDSNTAWTRVGKRKNAVDSRTLIDFILVTHDLTPRIRNVRIMEYPDNCSDHLPVELDMDLNLEIFHNLKKPSPYCINWKKVIGETQIQYESVMEKELNDITIPLITHGTTICNCVEHIFQIEKYHQDIVNAVLKADSVLPRSKPTVERDFWDDELKRLKSESIDAYDLWQTSNKPSHGPIFELKKTAHYRYKAYLRKCQRESNEYHNDALHENLIEGNQNRFWQSWKSIHASGTNTNPSRINGFFKDEDIANCFADSFESVYKSNDPFCASSIKKRFDSLYASYKNEHAYDNISAYYFSWSDMLDVVSKLKSGKATASFMKYEHVLLGSPKLIIHLQILFNAIIQHGHVPHEFLSGLITPLVKDSEGDVTSTANYRGLTLSVVFASMLESAILLKIGHLLITDPLQFGYKPKHSTSHALFTLRSCIDYFVDHGSNVFVSFLDCSKGFDKVDHHGIFIKLIKRSVPLCILNVIMYWYLNMHSIVKWNGALSRSFHVTSGVRQGGILSPRLFTIYVDDLISTLRDSKIGCHLVDLFIAAIMYADDLALLAPTRSSLQKLLDICYTYGAEWCISYNPTKTAVMVFGQKNECQSLTLNSAPIEFVNKCKYLGVIVTADKSGRFSCTIDSFLSGFYRTSNTILNVLNRPSEQISMHLLYSICVPKLTYACEVRSHSARDMMRMDVALNDSIRKIFTFQRWESTRYLRQSFGYKSISETFNRRIKSFRFNLKFTYNPLLFALARLLW